MDELRLMVYSLVLGGGKRFFSSEARLPLKLSASRELGAGVVLLIYALDRGLKRLLAPRQL